MPDSQATPNTDDKISALEALVTKLAHKVDSMVSHTVMRRADSARGDDRRDDSGRSDDRRDDSGRSDDDDKAKKDAARATLFGGKRKDAKRDDAEEGEEKEEEEKEAKGDDDDSKRSDDRRDDAEECEEEKGEPEAMASDDDRRKDRRKDDRRDRSDDDKRDDSRSDDRRDDRRDARSDDRRDDSGRSDDDRRDSRSDDDRKDRRDDSRADSMIRNLRRELDDLRRSMRRPRIMTDDELNALSEKQTEWDRVAQMHGQRASRPLDGERIESYDRRMAKIFQKHSKKWGDTDLASMPIEVVTKVIAPEIRADSIKAAHDPLTSSHGGMQREIIKSDRTGRKISEFVGPVDAPNGMFKPFELPPMRFRGFNRSPNQF